METSIVDLSSPNGHRAGYPRPRSQSAVVGVAIILCAVYCVAVHGHPASWWPQFAVDGLVSIQRLLNGAVVRAIHGIGRSSPSVELRSGTYLVLTAVVIPWVVLALLGRGRPYDLGLRRPNRIGWRWLIIGYLSALPFQYWMVRGPSFAGYYAPHLARAGIAAFGMYYLVNMLSEHFFFHGALLAACRAGRRWPPPPPIEANADNRWRRLAQWFGLAQACGNSRGLPRVLRWIGLPPGCVPAVLTSATLFGIIHIGKDPREMVLSLPGGLVLAWLAFRGNSWLIPFFLHVASAGTALAMMTFLR